MEQVITNTAIVVVMVIVCYPLYYLIGLGFSRGFHRGKQEHIMSLLNSSKEPSSGTRQRT